jgi:tRNA(Met) C34 N-acetyltransferase TmcA
MLRNGAAASAAGTGHAWFGDFIVDRFGKMHALEIVLSFLAALIGAFVGAWASVRTVVDASRIRWIDTLREDVSDLLVIGTDLRRKRLRENRINEQEASRLKQLDFKIRLMLNPSESKHVELGNSINHFVQITLNKSIEDSEYYQTRQDVFCLCRCLLKQEWDRISKLWLRRLFQSRRRQALNSRAASGKGAAR